MTLRPAPIPPPPKFYGGLLALLFVYLTFARLHEGTSTFLLLRDQMRDWTLALGPFRALPLTGPQSTAGGASLGPIYYWVLWLTRCLIGPWFNNLPLAGAYGIAVLQGCADLFLFDTIRRRTGSSWVAFAVTLLGATSPHEGACQMVSQARSTSQHASMRGPPCGPPRRPPRRPQVSLSDR